MARFTKLNERSEAIELIKLMDSIAKRNTWQIKTIGGENTLNNGQERMFPDLLIYGDTARTHILQGWEVKMPDVPITDGVFIEDAKRKANVLGVNSCFIWNFSCGALYVKDSLGKWEKRKVWDDTRHIKTRADVAYYKGDWESLIADILCELNGYFNTGELFPSKLDYIISETIYAELLLRNKNITAEHLRSESLKNTVIKAFISQWWRSVEKEYRFDERDQFAAYALFILLNWINKITFAHLIKMLHSPAALVESICEEITPSAANAIFKEITSKCDFFNIFEPIEYSELLPHSAWIDLTDYNAFMSDNGIKDVSQEALQSILENSVKQFKRHVAGVYATPQKLASLLVKAGIVDITAPCIDPCCGTGTIAKETLLEKESALGIDRALATTYASDKYSFPLQISSIALTKPNAVNKPSFLFCSNVFELHEGKEIQITNPQNGEKQLYYLPKLASVVSNLPFVAFDQEGREDGDFIRTILKRVKAETGINLSERLDLYQAILLHLHTLLADSGAAAVITSNSWLGTLAGEEFFRALSRYYIIESVVASGNGKWFDNADIVTVMLLLKRKSLTSLNDNNKVFFGLIRKPLSSLTTDDLEQLADYIKLKNPADSSLVTFKSYTIEKINETLDMNIALNSCFYDIEWLTSLRSFLCPVTELFHVFRGMKTGQDEIYYLKNPSDIDKDYAGLVFKSAKSAEYLTAQADAYSFVCDKSLEELAALGHHKTIEFINRFKRHINQSVPNRDMFWTNLSGNRLSGSKKVRLFTGMNPERRIFYGLLNEPTQINQRAIGFNPLTEAVNIELCHALLNSVIGVFYTEATGFPKGLGALDNRAENLKKILMLSPHHLSDNKAKRIMKAFKPLLARKIMAVAEEYQQSDRLSFERTVAECFGYTSLLNRIIAAALEMQKVRLSVKKR
jgi:hypothetical protein